MKDRSQWLAGQPVQLKMRDLHLPRGLVSKNNGREQQSKTTDFLTSDFFLYTHRGEYIHVYYTCTHHTCTNAVMPQQGIMTTGCTMCPSLVTCPVSETAQKRLRAWLCSSQLPWSSTPNPRHKITGVYSHIVPSPPPTPPPRLPPLQALSICDSTSQGPEHVRQLPQF